MKKVWNVLGTIGSFISGFVIGKMVMSSILNSPFLTFVTNDKEIIIGFAVLTGLLIATWWYREFSKPKE